MCPPPEPTPVLSEDERRRRYTMALLEDVQAFERMLDERRFEEGIRRIGAEQEMFLVDRAMQPAPVADKLLADNERPELVHELALFNLEANCQPRELGGRCLSEMEAELRELVGLADDLAGRHGARVMLCGILPTLRMSDLGDENMTPKPRYREINEATIAARGGQFEAFIKGRDELAVTHSNVMLESCNTSFQIHFQVAPAEFALLYNMAQAITAPVLAAAVNSPLLLGRQLWDETRVALFQQSVDARTRAEAARNVRPRVGFGDAWVRESAVEVWRENIARFRVLFHTDLEEHPLSVLDKGGIPELSALRFHNGTVYRWNRVCYGHDGKIAHIRIENRVLPAGPTILDEMANAAFFHGLMSGGVEDYGDIQQRMAFDDAKNNFFAAARYGLKAQFTWVDGQTITASDLILRHLLPLARKGLERRKIDPADVDRYLGIIEKRVTSGMTGARWACESLRAMGSKGTTDLRHRALTQAMLRRGFASTPVHEWDLARPDELDDVDEWRDSYRSVGQIMTTDVFTVRPNDLVDLAASVMDWEHVRHVPVEDATGKVVGMLSHRSLLRLIARGQARGEPLAVEHVMKRDPVMVTPMMPTLDAIGLMREHRVGALPVVDAAEHLVGIITESDLIDVAARLLDGHLRGAGDR